MFDKNVMEDENHCKVWDNIIRLFYEIKSNIIIKNLKDINTIGFNIGFNKYIRPFTLIFVLESSFYNIINENDLDYYFVDFICEYTYRSKKKRIIMVQISFVVIVLLNQVWKIKVKNV